MLTNDLTLRNVLPLEFAKGIGFFQAKPLRPFAPFAVSIDALGDAWRDGLLHATVKSWVRGRQLGAVESGVDCYFDFRKLIVHAALTRPLAAGTVIGSGTISNHDEANGFGCLAELRAVETMAGEPPTPYLQPGDSVKVEAFDAGGRSIFGAMDAAVVAD
jgi:fumarylacetoacetate (FAA) hydrolase